MSELVVDTTFSRSSGHRLHAQFSVAAGEVLAVVGPNGAGKSTLLSLIAGLLRPDSGTVRLGDRALFSESENIFIAAHRRRISLLLQDSLLFPHMSVRANVEFGPRSLGRSRSECTRTALQWLDAVGAADLAGRRPRELSGGQAQRVAIARALAAEPELILLDEPLSGLDATSAPDIRSLLTTVLGKGRTTAIIVTHDLLDVVTTASRVLVLDGGEVAETGDVTTILGQPTSRFGARFAGVNLAAGIAGPDGTLTDGELTFHGTGAVAQGQHAVAVFHPRSVTVHRNPPEGSQRNVFPAVVRELTALGDSVVVTAIAVTAPTESAIFTAHVTAAAAAELQLAPQVPVYFAVKALEVRLFEAR